MKRVTGLLPTKFGICRFQMDTPTEVTIFLGAGPGATLTVDDSEYKGQISLQRRYDGKWQEIFNPNYNYIKRVEGTDFSNTIRYLLLDEWTQHIADDSNAGILTLAAYVSLENAHQKLCNDLHKIAEQFKLASTTFDKTWISVRDDLTATLQDIKVSSAEVVEG